MNLIRRLHITNVREAIHQKGMVEIIKLMKGKTFHFNRKVEGIEPRTPTSLNKRGFPWAEMPLSIEEGSIAVPNIQMVAISAIDQLFSGHPKCLDMIFRY